MEQNNEEQGSKMPDTVPGGKSTEMVPFDINALEGHLNERFTVSETIRRVAIERTKPAHWIDQSGKPYLNEAGAVHLIKALQGKIMAETVKYYDPTEVKHKDGSIELVFKVSGTIDFDSVSKMGYAHNSGSCSTRHPWHGTVKGQVKPLDKVSIPVIQSHAYTAWQRRVVTHHFELHDLEWAELTAINPAISQATCKKIQRAGSGGSGKSYDRTEAGKKKLEIIREWLNEMFRYKAKEGRDYILKITTNENKGIKGVTSPDEFSPARVDFLGNVTIRQAYKKWCEENGVEPKHLEEWKQLMEKEPKK